ncbi:hypothetical protein A2U01_0114353, partial [Trifolium medium]|nr:hypothetical protein [Trifolium medium]
MSLKESMRVHEELLNLAFAEEEAVIHRIKVLEDELKLLGASKKCKRALEDLQNKALEAAQ